MIENNVALYLIDIFSLIFLFGMVHGYNLLGNQRKNSFSLGIIFVILVIISEAGTIFACGGGPELRGLNILFNIIGFALTPVIPIILIAIFDIKTLRLHKLFLLPTIINVFLVALSPFFGLIFSVDANNQYERGILFFLFVAVYIVNIVLLAVTIGYIGQKYLYPIRGKIALLAVFTISATCIQLVIPSMYISWHCATLAMLLLYILLSDFDSSFDPLTKLYNRAAFEKDSRRLNMKRPFAVIVIDIDNFKEVNDRHGHDYGDAVLKKLGAIIRASFGNNCSCYRIGGDEFCVISRDIKKDRIEKQLKSMTNSLTVKREKDNWMPTVAYGYSVFRRGEPLDFDNIMKKADDQMYYYKNLKRE